MNTPQTSPTGNVHGMPLAVLLGEGSRELVELARGQPAVAGEHVCVFGVRDSDPGESELLRSSRARIYTMSEIDRRGAATCIDEAIERVTRDTAGFHLSFDIDALDPSVAPGTGTREPGGPTYDTGTVAP